MGRAHGISDNNHAGRNMIKKPKNSDQRFGDNIFRYVFANRASGHVIVSRSCPNVASPMMSNAARLTQSSMSMRPSPAMVT